MKKLSIEQLFDRAEKVNYEKSSLFFENTALDGKSYLSQSYQKVRKFPLKITLHNSFCDPKEVIEDVEKKSKNKTVINYYQNGNYVADVIIADYKVKIKQVIQEVITFAEIEVTLLESALPLNILKYSNENLNSYSMTSNTMKNFIANVEKITKIKPYELAVNYAVSNALSTNEAQVLNSIKAKVINDIKTQGLFYANDIIKNNITEIENSDIISPLGIETIKQVLNEIPTIIYLSTIRQPIEDIVKPQVLPQQWVMPCDGMVSSTYGWRKDPFTNQQTLHNGWDISVPIKTPIKSIADGKVYFAGKGDFQGYAHFIIIDHGYINGKVVTSEYGHISKHNVYKGQNIKQGQIIGESGNEGKLTNPHLHLTIREGAYKGTAVDPSKYIKY